MAEDGREIWCDKPAWRGARLSLELFGILAGVMGVGLVLAEVLTMNRLSRVEQAFGFVERYSAEPLIAHRTRLAAAAEEINAALAAGGTGAILSGADRDRVIDAYFLTDTPEARENLQSLTRIVRFFEEVAICEAVGSCDTEVLCQFFATPARQMAEDFARIYGVYAERNGLENFGAGFAHLADPEEMKCENLFEGG